MATEPSPAVVFLAGGCLYLRPVEAGDVREFQRWRNDPDVRRYMRPYLPTTARMQQDMLERGQAGPDRVRLAIVLRDGNRHIGGTGLSVCWKDRRADLGLVIGPADCRDRGYGTTATRLIVRYGFETLNLHRIELSVYANNPRAIRVYEKVGFVREGVRRENVFIDGRYVDELIYGLLAREYARRA